MRLLAAFCLLFLVDCSSPPTQPEGPSETIYVDESQTWSPVGDSIAYHRTISSSEGPPGVYIVHVSGTGTRLVVADNEQPFQDLQYSPDGTMLAGSRDGQLVLITLSTGAVTEPFHTDYYAVQPDWSPDQSRIVLSRIVLSPSGIPDSSGIHLFDFATNRCLPLIPSNTNPTYGLDAHWSPDGSTIAFVDDSGLRLVDADGTNARLIVGVQAGEILRNPRWIEGGQRILYEHYFDGTFTTWVTTADGNVRGRWQSRLGDAEAISPDGQRIVVRSGRRDRTTLYVLLFRRSLYGMADEVLIPVTHYSP